MIEPEPDVISEEVKETVQSRNFLSRLYHRIFSSRKKNNNTPPDIRNTSGGEKEDENLMTGFDYDDLANFAGF